MRLRRGILRPHRLAWFTESKLAEGERRMVDLTGAKPNRDPNVIDGLRASLAMWETLRKLGLPAA